MEKSKAILIFIIVFCIHNLNALDSCEELFGNEQVECFRNAGDNALINSEFDDAALYYIKAGEDEATVYLMIADTALRRRYFDIAEEYYGLISNYEGYKKLGDAYFDDGIYEKSIELYLLAGETEESVCLKIAEDIFSYSNDVELSVEYIKQAGIEDENEISKIIAESAFKNNKYDIAAEYYIKAGENENIIYKKMADNAFENEYYSIAAKYYDMLGDTEKLKEIADYYFKKQDYEKALEYYTKIGDVEKILICEQNIEAKTRLNNKKSPSIQALQTRALIANLVLGTSAVLMMKYAKDAAFGDESAEVPATIFLISCCVSATVGLSAAFKIMKIRRES